MLAEKDKIFINLHGGLGVDLASHKKRGDWLDTKQILANGRDWLIEQVKAFVL